MFHSRSNYFMALMLVMVLAACVRVGDFQEETRTFPLDGYESASIVLDIATGELEVQAGARELFEGVFAYNVEKWQPEFYDERRGGSIRLTVKQGDVSGIPMGNSKNRWDVYLNESIPLDLDVDFGAGQGRLDLRGLDLRSLNIDMGVGDLTVDLSGNLERDLRVTIDGGVGSATLYLPEDIGVKVYVDKGIGSLNARGFTKRGDAYTNEAYERSGVTLTVDIDAGIGSIDLRQR